MPTQSGNAREAEANWIVDSWPGMSRSQGRIMDTKLPMVAQMYHKWQEEMQEL